MLTLESYVSLTKALAKVRLPEEPKPVERAFTRIENTASEASEMMVARLGDDVDAGLERLFDLLVDRVWLIARSMLEFWELYRHPGLGLLDEEERKAIELDDNRELAEVAGDLLGRLFGQAGSEFLRKAYPQQATEMAARLELIDDKGLSETFIELVGPRVATMLRVFQARYEAMVAERASREGGNIGDRRALGLRMRRVVRLYSSAVLGTLDEEVPESAGWIERALRPLTLAGEPRRSSGAGAEAAAQGEGGDGGGEAEPDGAEPDGAEPDGAEPAEPDEAEPAME